MIPATPHASPFPKLPSQSISRQLLATCDSTPPQRCGLPTAPYKCAGCASYNCTASPSCVCLVDSNTTGGYSGDGCQDTARFTLTFPSPQCTWQPFTGYVYTLGTVGGNRTLLMRAHVLNSSNHVFYDSGYADRTSNWSFAVAGLSPGSYSASASSHLDYMPLASQNYSQTVAFAISATPALTVLSGGTYGFLSFGQTAPTCAGSCGLYAHQPLTMGSYVPPAFCHLPAANVRYLWNVTDLSNGLEASLPSSVSVTTSALALPGDALEATKSYKVTVSVRWVTAGGVVVTGSEGYSYTNSSTMLTVYTQPITVSIQQGTELAVGVTDSVSLVGLVSDPDNGKYAITGSWTMLNATTGGQICPQGVDCSNTALLSIPSGMLTLGSHVFTLTVTKPGSPQSYTRQCTVTVQTATVPAVSISRANQAAAFASGTVLTLSGVSPTAVTWQWSVQCSVNNVLYDVCNPVIDLDASAIASTLSSSTTQNISLLPDTLGPYGLQYQFKLTVTDSLGRSATATTVLYTAYPPECDGNCLTVTPASGTGLNTTFTISAPLGSPSTGGWYDRDSDTSFTYTFGYTRNGQRYALNTVPTTSSSFSGVAPPGSIAPWVTINDPVHGSVGPIGLGQSSSQTTPLSGTAASIQLGAPADTSASALQTYLSALGSTASDVYLGVVAIGLSMPAAPDPTYNTLRQNLATKLQQTVQGGAGNQTALASGALSALLEAHTSLQPATLSVLGSTLDDVLSAMSGAINQATSLNLLEATANLAAAGSSSRRSSTQNDRIRKIAHASAKGLTVADPPMLLVLGHSSGVVHLQVQKVIASAASSSTFGGESLGGIVKAPGGDSTAVFTVAVLVVSPGSALDSKQHPAESYSNVLSAMVLSDTGAVVVSPTGSTMEITLYNTKDNPSPTCRSASQDATEFSSSDCSVVLASSYQSVGGAVTCSCTTTSAVLDVALGSGCSASVNCSSHGTCQKDATCLCDESYWGTSCSTQRCTDVTLCGPHGWHGVCNFNESASSAMAPGYPLSLIHI
eukprot:TRINITY_DN3746_c0_g1_i13.p1 TRINITY_DN3746_c0_g1~~TRINITY_DN3746_c0_g1_i13.p1  ORF type:complete len:1026 (-),score=157.28 TRINITY_DN3746_c0_g1_i13:134-3211(-)